LEDLELRKKFLQGQESKDLELRKEREPFKDRNWKNWSCQRFFRRKVGEKGKTKWAVRGGASEYKGPQ
jgi:hypothetical protein